MDLGCIDMGCVEKPGKETSAEKDNSPKETGTSASKLGKNSKAKDALSVLNKLTSQISKPPHRKTSSPINWFPRKKVEPYLKRKIKMLQEVDGMHLTLDETLCDSNPHYSRVLREKIAIREAAEKAMEARKAAMVEASWCRILQAARIECKEAEAQLSKAEVSAAEAIEAARAVGVIMNDIPDSTQNQFKIDTGSTTHAISATFETAFEVDRQVAAAVKAAFMKLANSPSIDKHEFKELLRKISENPDTDENCCYSGLLELTSECESDSGSEMETGPFKDRLKKHEIIPEVDKFNMANIVDMMLGRLQCLKEDDLASLAIIVATSGLNAVLAETGNSTQPIENKKNPCPKASKRMSVSERNARNSSIIGHSRGTTDAELPSLDKFLVKRLTRLEREVLEAKNARKNEAGDDGSEEKLHSKDVTSSRAEVRHKDASDLGSVLVKCSSKLEKEVEEARRNCKLSEVDSKKSQREALLAKQDAADVPSLDKYFVKRMTRLEREVQEARNRNRLELIEKTKTPLEHATNSEETQFGDLKGKENISTNLSHEDASSKTDDENYESLDKVLVRHVSRLEKEKSAFCADNQMRVKLKRKDMSRDLESNEGSLDQVLVKHKSRLEREKIAAGEEQQQEDSTRHSVSRRQARERELQAAWGGLSLGNSIRPHESRLEREKIAAGEERQQQDSTRHSVSRRQVREKELQAAWGGLSLGNSICPHVSRLQKEKAAWLKAEEDERNSAVTEAA